MITTDEIKQTIQNALNDTTLQTTYTFVIGTEEKQQNYLPNYTNGNSTVDNTVYGVFHTIAGQFEAIQGQDMVTLQTELVLYVMKSQMNDMFTILSTYQTQNNAVPFTIDDYNIVPVFNALRPQDISQFQGEDRIPFSIIITYTIAKIGIISNSVIIKINGVRQIILESAFSMVKSSEKANYSGSYRIVGVPSKKTLVCSMRILNVNSTISTALKNEILTDSDTKVTYQIYYNDGSVETTNNMFLENGNINLVAGNVTLLVLSFSLARE